MTRLIKLSFGSLLVLMATVAGLGGLNLYTYDRFTHETSIATLRFVEIAPRRYRVLVLAEGSAPRAFELAGDEWQLDVRMIKWSDWLTFLGEDPLYRLDRISGRYISASDARSHLPVVHELAEVSSFDIWAFARDADSWLPGIDAAYGSSVYLPMVDGAVYDVSMTRTGLLARKTVGDEVSAR